MWGTNLSFWTVADKACRTLIVLVMKLYIGAFRPNFFDVCQPNMTMLNDEIARHIQNHTAMFFNATVCTGKKNLVKNA